MKTFTFIEPQGVVDYCPGDISGPVVVEPKLDGWRCLISWTNGVPVLYTRNGEEIPLPHIQREAALLMPPGFFLDGELFHPCGFSGIKSAIAHQDEALHYHVFDMVDEAFFEEGFDPRPYQERRWELDKCFRFANIQEDNHVHIIWSVKCMQDQIENVHAIRLELGFEGSVIKRLDSSYASGPTGDWMRIKPVQTADCVIIGVEQSETDPTRASSFIVCEPLGVTSKVHAGLTEDALRKALENPSSVINRVMEVAHRGRYKSGRMRNASFVRMRPDKTAAPQAQGVLV